MTDWVQVQPPHTDRIVEGVIHKYIRDLQGDLIEVKGLAKRMPEIAQNAVIVYKHGRDPQRGVVPLGRICAWKEAGDEILIQSSFNRGNEIVDAIWREEVVPLGTRAGFSIGGGTKHECKVCRMEAGQKMCDISDVIVCEVSWTPHPANPGAMVTRVNTLAKEEPEQKQVGEIVGAVVSMIGAGGGSDKTTQGPKGEVDDEEKSVDALELEKAVGEPAEEQNRCNFKDPGTGRTCTRERGHGAAHLSHRQVTGMKFHTVFTEKAGMSAEGELSKPPKQRVEPGRARPKDSFETDGGASDPGDHSPYAKCGDKVARCVADVKRDGKSEESAYAICNDRIKKEAVESELESRITALYRQLPERAMAEVAVQGCGTCDDYVSSRVRNRNESVAKAMMYLDRLLEGAWELSQKDAQQKGGTMPDEKKELPKETDGEEKVRKALEERIVALEKQVAALSGVQKESAGFAEAKIGIGEGPLAGVPTQAPPTIDMTNMATTKSESFAKDEQEAIVKLVKAGYKVEGFQKGTAQNVPPKQPGAPAGVEKEVMQKMAEADPNVKAVLAWAQNDRVR